MFQSQKKDLKAINCLNSIVTERVQGMYMSPRLFYMAAGWFIKAWMDHSATLATNGSSTYSAIFRKKKLKNGCHP